MRVRAVQRPFRVDERCHNFRVFVAGYARAALYFGAIVGGYGYGRNEWHA
jgi:hypothetical protein